MFTKLCWRCVLSAAGDQFTAVKPWIGAIKEPSKPVATNPGEPVINVEVSHAAAGLLCVAPRLLM